MTFTSRKWYDTAVLMAVPIVLIALGILFRTAGGPFGADPDFPYLLNGLNILTLHAPGHYDHPGTTVQIFAALVILPAWLLSLPVHGTMALKTSVLSQPQYYLHIINLALLAANAGAAYYFGWRVRAVSSLATAVVGQLSILASFSVMIGLDRVTPEPLLLAATLTTAGYLAPLALHRENFNPTLSYARRLGVLLGFALVTKITALPTLFTICFLQRPQLRVSAIKAMMITGLVLTLPIAIHYLQMVRWFGRIFIHTGLMAGVRWACYPWTASGRPF